MLGSHVRRAGDVPYQRSTELLPAAAAAAAAQALQAAMMAGASPQPTLHAQQQPMMPPLGGTGSSAAPLPPRGDATPSAATAAAAAATDALCAEAAFSPEVAASFMKKLWCSCCPAPVPVACDAQPLKALPIYADPGEIRAAGSGSTGLETALHRVFGAEGLQALFGTPQAVGAKRIAEGGMNHIFMVALAGRVVKCVRPKGVGQSEALETERLRLTTPSLMEDAHALFPLAAFQCRAASPTVPLPPGSTEPCEVLVFEYLHGCRTVGDLVRSFERTHATGRLQSSACCMTYRQSGSCPHAAAIRHLLAVQVPLLGRRFQALHGRRHGDFKVDNVMVERNGNLRLADFLSPFCRNCDREEFLSSTVTLHPLVQELRDCFPAYWEQALPTATRESVSSAGRWSPVDTRSNAQLLHELADLDVARRTSPHGLFGEVPSLLDCINGGLGVKFSTPSLPPFPPAGDLLLNGIASPPQHLHPSLPLSSESRCSSFAHPESPGSCSMPMRSPLAAAGATRVLAPPTASGGGPLLGEPAAAAAILQPSSPLAGFPGGAGASIAVSGAASVPNPTSVACGLEAASGTFPPPQGGSVTISFLASTGLMAPSLTPPPQLSLPMLALGRMGSLGDGSFMDTSSPMSPPCFAMTDLRHGSPFDRPGGSPAGIHHSSGRGSPFGGWPGLPTAAAGQPPPRQQHPATANGTQSPIGWSSFGLGPGGSAGFGHFGPALPPCSSFAVGVGPPPSPTGAAAMAAVAAPPAAFAAAAATAMAASTVPSPTNLRPMMAAQQFVYQHVS